MKVHNKPNIRFVHCESVRTVKPGINYVYWKPAQPNTDMEATMKFLCHKILAEGFQQYQACLAHATREHPGEVQQGHTLQGHCTFPGDGTALSHSAQEGMMVAI